LQKCGERISKGDLPGDTDCGSTPDTTAAISKAEATLRRGIGNACGGKNKVCNAGDVGAAEDDPLSAIGWNLGTGPTIEGISCAIGISDCDDVARCLACAAGGVANGAYALYYQTLTFPGGADKSLRKCRDTIGKESAKLFAAEMKAFQQCWTAVNKAKVGVSAP